MKTRKELAELRTKDPQTLLTDLAREKEQLARERIAVTLGKQSKVHELKIRRARVARLLTVLSEKLTQSAKPKESS